MIYKKKESKYWYTKFELTHNDRRKRINKSTLQTAKAKAEAFEAQLKQEIWQQLINPEPESHRFSEAVCLYLESRQTNRTIKEKASKLKWWQEQLADPNIQNVNTHLVLTMLSKKQDSSTATRNRYLAELKAFLNFCHQELGWIDKIPVLKIQKEPRRAFFKLDNSDVKRLLEYSPPYLQSVIMFALLTGLRRNNIFSLRWSQIDFVKQCIYIDAKEHKSKDHVITPLSEKALQLLVQLREQRSSPYVFVNSLNNPVKDIKDLLWKRITKQAQLDGLRFHDLRHNWATRHIEAGTDLLALKELGGWKTLEMVQRYAHPSSEYLALQAKNIDRPTQRLDSVSVKQASEFITTNMALDSCDKLDNENRNCGKKSSQLEVNSAERSEKHVLENKKPVEFQRVIKWYQWTDLNRHARRQRILNPSCLPIPSHWLHFSLIFFKKR
ncbi:site-specific recombinase, phage integrase family [Pseudoalteromonas luteoviolacea B = ATCC 29581]|nr:site-specific recombinase, phage integrase family [Pseudoalteromonas luteoviolacea B = ATCC 29581]